MIQRYHEPSAIPSPATSLSLVRPDSALAFSWEHDAGAFRALKPEWDVLLAEAGHQTVFLTHDWLDCWWEVYGKDREMWVLLARDEAGALVGAVPLMLERGADLIRRLAFIGAGEAIPNHLDMIALPGWRQAVLSGLVTKMEETSSRWDLFELDKMPGDSETPAGLAGELDKVGVHTTVEVTARCPYVELPDTFETYIMSRGSTTRQNSRRKRRHMESEYPDIKFTHVQTIDELSRVMSALIRLHQARWTAKGYTGAFATPSFIQFHQKFAVRALQAGALRFHFATTDSDVVTAIYCFRTGGKVEAYMIAFDERWAKYSPSLLVASYAIEQSILEGAAVFDFLQGEEPYKEPWITGVRDNLRLRAFSPGWRGRAARARVQGVETLQAMGVRYLPTGVRRPIWQTIQRLKVARTQHE